MYELKKPYTQKERLAFIVKYNHQQGFVITETAQGLTAAAPVNCGLSVAERLTALESKTGLTRAVRELVLAANSGVSGYLRTQAQELENLAQTLRTPEEAEQ